MKGRIKNTAVLFEGKAEQIFRLVALLCLASILLILVSLIADITLSAIPRLNSAFFLGYPSRFAEKAGAYPAIMGSFYLVVLTAIIAFPLGVGAAIYLEEYAPNNRFTRFIELNVVNLSGVPSIIFGLLGQQIFVRSLHLERSLIAGALTMALLALPIIVLAAREALRIVPSSLREASLALGASKWQTIWHQVLPVALPGILTGSILAFSRVLGETAPLITLGAVAFVPFAPESIFSPFSVLPIQAFNWTSRPQTSFHANAAAASLVLLGLMLFVNSLAIWLRNRSSKKRLY